ncbi:MULTISPECIES: WXG100 family type VII secretion target [Nocardia]|uniref:WXG100 family type VII secretion target n=1 Tax=Nocardia TaxID=1817 RepID=UPI0018930360|nr:MULTISPECIES: WXG100 family type VII secretion target [Nocardia]MBF6351424.1 WXG100 family type VII secretion target [Nocardia flavorosea]
MTTPNETDLLHDSVAVDNAKNDMSSFVVDAIRITARNLQADVEASAPSWAGDARTAFVEFQNRLNASIVNLNSRLDELTVTMGTGTKKVLAQEVDASSMFTNLAQQA